MKSQDIKVYREIQKNADMARKAIDTISDKVYDERLAIEISGQFLSYSEIYNEASRELLGAKTEGYRSSYLEDLRLRVGIHYNTLLNTSTEHLAELLIKGSNEGILEMKKVLKQNDEAGEKSVILAHRFLDCEEKNARRLEKYL